MLPSGMRAVAINIDPSGGATAGGFILPNDRVDVIRVYRDEEQTKALGVEVNTAQTILTNVRVLAIGQTVQEKGGEKTVVGANATLELDPAQAELIVLAQRTAGAGNLHLTLRSMLDAAGKTGFGRRSGDRQGRRPDDRARRRAAASQPMRNAMSQAPKSQTGAPIDGNSSRHSPGGRRRRRRSQQRFLATPPIALPAAGADDRQNRRRSARRPSPAACSSASASR